jgi:hypothetical protein
MLILVVQVETWPGTMRVGSNKAWVADMFAKVPALPVIGAAHLFATNVTGKPVHSKVVNWLMPAVVPQVDLCRYLVP